MHRISLLLLILFTSCSDENQSVQVKMRVNYYTEECTGEMTGQCLLVQEGQAIGGDEWSYLYYENSIEGFYYEPGYIYDLMVKKTPVDNPPADGSSIEYSLVNIIAKTQYTAD